MSKYNYFDVVTVDGYDFPTVPQVNFGFNSEGFSFLNRGSHTVEYSFNGVDVHGDLVPTDETKGLVFDVRNECKVWFKCVTGSTTVRIEAWGFWGKS